jgi:ABC-type multidrug transport system ATPase subunit
MPALLVAEDVRVDVDGVPAVDGLTLRTSTERVLVLGAPRALFEATCGIRAVVRGRLLVRDAPSIDAVRAREIAGAALDPPLPPKWTPIEYVEWSARLAGLERPVALANANEALKKLQLDQLATMQLGRLVPHARRGVVIAAAMATGAPVLAMEDPIGALPEEMARSFANVLTKALDGRSWIVFAPRIPLTSPLAAAAHEAIVASSARVDAQGPPAEIAAAQRRFALRVHGPVEALAALLSQRGVKLQQDGARIVVDLASGVTTSDLLRLAGEANVTVVELHPVARAFG